MGFRGGSVGKESAYQCRRCEFVPWVGKIPWRRQPTPVLLPGKFHGQESLVGQSPWDCRRVKYDLVTKKTKNKGVLIGILHLGCPGSCLQHSGSFQLKCVNSQLWHTNSSLHPFGIQFPDQELNLGRLYWECGVLATGPPGKPPYPHHSFNIHQIIDDQKSLL